MPASRTAESEPPIPENINLSAVERLLSAAGGGLLVLAGLWRGGFSGAGRGMVGAELLRRGLSGRSHLYDSLGVSTAGGRLRVEIPDIDSDPALAVRRTVTIFRPRDEIYRLWRDLEGLPRFLDHVERVEALDERRSRWTARGPAGVKIAWDAEITDDREGERIAWQTLQAADIPHRGEIRFRDAPADRGTEVELLFDYAPPGGTVGRAVVGALDHPPGGRATRAVSELLGASPAAEAAKALRRLKQVAEAGETPTTEGQPTARERDRRRPGGPPPKENDPWRLEPERRRWRRRGPSTADTESEPDANAPPEEDQAPGGASGGAP